MLGKHGASRSADILCEAIVGDGGSSESTEQRTISLTPAKVDLVNLFHKFSSSSLMTIGRRSPVNGNNSSHTTLAKSYLHASFHLQLQRSPVAQRGWTNTEVQPESESSSEERDEEEEIKRKKRNSFSNEREAK